MKKLVNRYPKRALKLRIMVGKNIINKDHNLFVKKYNACGIIQLMNSDFKLINKNTKRLTHFNIQNTGHKPGQKYIIIKIKKRGYFNGVIFKQPILDSNSVILSECISVRNFVHYKNLKKSVFKNSLSNIKNINSLKQTVKRRYKKSLAHFSDREKISMGIAITKLKIIKRF